jgi:hypothetical protein
VLSYLFYLFAVAVVAGSLGYVITSLILHALNLSAGWLIWIIAMIVAVVVIFVTFKFNLQKWVIIIATSILGAGVVASTIIYVLYPSADKFMESPVKAALQASPLLMILFVVMAVAGVIVQYRQNKSFTLDSYNKWEEPA